MSELVECATHGATCGIDQTIPGWNRHPTCKATRRKLTDTEAGPKPCVLCGTQPQAIGLHCNNCWNDLADQDA